MSLVAARRASPAVPSELKRLVAAALAGRFHSTASNVVISLAVQRWTGSFASSGLVIGALVLGQGASAPFRGRAADRWAVPTLVICGVAYMVGLTTLAALTHSAAPSRVALAVGAAFISGTALPPVAPVLRSAIPTLARNEAQTHSTLSWEASSQELIFIAGPPLALGVAAVTNPSTALLVLGICAGAGAATFAAVLRRQLVRQAQRTVVAVDARPRTVRHARGPRSSARRACTKWGVIARLALTYGVILGALTSTTLVAVTVAVRAGQPAMSGVLEAVLAVGSVIGGTLAARGLLDRLTLSGRMAGMAIGLSALAGVCALTSSVLAVGCVLIAAGFWVAPSLAVQAVAVLEASDPARRAEMFGWVNAAGLGVNAAMTPVTGWVLDLRGPAAGATLGALSIALGATLATGLTHRGGSGSL